MAPMRARHLTTLALAVVLLPALARPVWAKPKVAVLGLEVTGKSGNDPKAISAAKSLTHALRHEANRPAGPFDLAPGSNKDLLEMKMLSGCSDEGHSCMADIGKQLGAAKLIYGRLERASGGYKVALNLLDTSSGSLEKQSSEVIPLGDMAGSSLEHSARTLYGRLTGAPQEGVLDITANAERGTVYVDGKIRTTLSAGSARVTGLSEGMHSVSIEAPGYDRFKTDVGITGGQTESLKASMTESAGGGGGGEGEGRPGHAWRVAFVSGMIATGVAGAAWTYSGFKVLSAEDDVSVASEAYTGGGLKDYIQNGQYTDACAAFKDSSKVPGGDMADFNAAARKVEDACDSGSRYRNLTNVFIATTGVAALFTAFAYYEGYIAPRHVSAREREEARRRRKHHKQGPTVVVTPAVGPGLVGAGLEITF